MTIYSRTSNEISTLQIMFRNIAATYEIRAASWYMGGITFGVGIMLTINPTLLTSTINAPAYFGLMTAFAPQSVWRALFLIAGTARLAALFINGSFPVIWWTPHVRAVMSAASAVLWSVVSLSIMHGVPTFGTVVYPALVVVELHNMRSAAADARIRGRHG